jgi:predicted P-loop ATPase
VLQLYSAEQHRILEVITNEGWHNTLLKLVGSLVAKRGSDEAIHRFTDGLTLQGYTVEDTRAEVQRMIDGARAKGFGTELAQESSAELIKSSRGDVINNHHNVYTTLRESIWGQLFAFNELTGTKMVLEKPPGERGNPAFFKPREVKDSDYSRVVKWCNKNGLPTVSKSVIIDCVQELCEENTTSPVRHYLEELRFDPENHEPQLSHWMERYLGAKSNTPEERQYIEAVSRLSLIQAVARALDPGCKADSVPILEGGQGIGKSTAIRVLHGAEWFGDSLPPMGTKDASDYLRGLWGIELAELSFQRKAEIEVQKAFISRREERFRPAYGREEILYPRRGVFWGTTNRTDYIKDDTGNRRFLPIRTAKIDVDGLKASRDMLWAEAVYYYNQGEQYWLSEELAVYANEQTNERFEEDPWVEVVQRKLREFTEISLRQACNESFENINDKDITKEMIRRMSHCLQMAGWRKDGRFNSGPQRNQARFVKEAEEAFEGDNAHERDCF